jgi:hypothetical protein
MNWDPEADALQEKVYSIAGIKEAMLKADLDSARARERESMAFFLNRIYGWSLETGEWKETKGEILVEELWALITKPS